MKKLLTSALFSAVSVLASNAALAGSCPQVGNAFSADVLRLANKAQEVDQLWDQIADDSDASDRAEELKDDTRDFHGVMFRKDCDDLAEDFDDILRDFNRLNTAIQNDAQLRRRLDVATQINQLKRVLNIVARDVDTIR